MRSTRRLLNLAIAAVCPFPGVLDYARTHV
jgi:hypothetical protein